MILADSSMAARGIDTKKLAAESDLMIVIAEQSLLGNSQRIGEILAAKEAGRPIAVFKKRGLKIPDYLFEGADVVHESEFDGSFPSSEEVVACIRKVLG